MIERYTLKFGPAVSQKELEKALQGRIDSPQIKDLHKLKARIELVRDYKDLHAIDEFIRHIREAEEKNGV